MIFALRVEQVSGIKNEYEAGNQEQEQEEVKYHGNDAATLGPRSASLSFFLSTTGTSLLHLCTCNSKVIHYIGYKFVIG